MISNKRPNTFAQTCLSTKLTLAVLRRTIHSRYRLAACRKDPAEVIVRRLSRHAAPSDTAVFDEELRVTLATARTVPSLAQNR